MKTTDTHKRSLVKTFSWRVIATTTTFVIAYIWTRDLAFAGFFGIGINFIKAIIYYIHERVWSHFSFGQRRVLPKGFTLWFTGLPSSGKSTLADAVAEELAKYAIPTERLDGDTIRQTICRDLGFSAEDRKKNIERVVFVSKLLTKNGAAVLTSFISPYRQVRDKAREEIGNFIEVYTKCSLEECQRRDPKGLYKMALAGNIPNFTGISDPYEEPENPEILVETDKENIEQCVKKIILYLKKRNYI